MKKLHKIFFGIATGFLLLTAFAYPQKSVLTEAQKTILGMEYSSKFADLDAAITSISTDDKILFIDSSETISSDLTIPSNVTLEFKNGAILTCTDTLTINGFISAGLYQIFSNISKVNLSNSLNTEVYPQWFGAYSDSTEGLITANAFQSTVNSLSSSGKTLKIMDGTYLIASSGYYGIEFGDNANWLGESQDKTILSFQTNYVAIGQEAGYASDYDKNNVSFKNFTIKGDLAKVNTATTQNGIYVYWRTPDPMFKNVEISNITAENFNSGGITATMGWNVLVQNCRTNNTGYTGSASITVTGVKCRVLNNIVDKSQVGMELLAQAIPTTLDTNYSFIVRGNIIEAEDVGLSINQSDFADITDNHITWVNITGKNDTTMYIAGTTPSVGLALWISHFKDLKIERNSFSGFTNHLQFTQSQKTYYDTTIYLGNTSIRNNYFSKSGARMITWNKTFYVNTKRITIADNDFYYWYYLQANGGVANPAVDLRSLDNVNISRNTFFTESGRSRTPLVLSSIDSINVSDNIFPTVFLMSGTNTNVRVFNNSYTDEVTYAYYIYDPPTYTQAQQDLQINEGGISVSGQLNTDSLFVNGFKLEGIRSYGSELVTNGLFWSNITGWTGQSSTLKWYNTDWNGVGFTNALLDSSTNTVNIATYATIDTLTLNSQYKIDFDYYIPSSNDTVDAIILSLVKDFGVSAQIYYTRYAGLDSLISVSKTVTADALYNKIYFYQAQTSGSKVSVIGDKIYLDNISVKEIVGSQATIDNILQGESYVLPSDSTGLNTGDLYFDPATGNVKRNY